MNFRYWEYKTLVWNLNCICSLTIYSKFWQVDFTWKSRFLYISWSTTDPSEVLQIRACNVHNNSRLDYSPNNSRQWPRFSIPWFLPPRFGIHDWLRLGATKSLTTNSVRKFWQEQDLVIFLSINILLTQSMTILIFRLFVSLFFVWKNNSYKTGNWYSLLMIIVCQLWLYTTIINIEFCKVKEWKQRNLFSRSIPYK